MSDRYWVRWTLPDLDPELEGAVTEALSSGWESSKSIASRREAGAFIWDALAWTSSDPAETTAMNGWHALPEAVTRGRLELWATDGAVEPWIANWKPETPAEMPEFSFVRDEVEGELLVDISVWELPTEVLGAPWSRFLPFPGPWIVQPDPQPITDEIGGSFQAVAPTSLFADLRERMLAWGALCRAYAPRAEVWIGVFDGDLPDVRLDVDRGRSAG